MPKLHLLLSALFAFTLPVLSLAQSSPPLVLIDEAFVKKHAAAYPTEIMQQCGCTEIEGVDLNQMLTGIKKAKWDMVPSSEMPVSAVDGLRTWAVYDPTDRTIKFNEANFRAQGLNKHRAMALNSVTLHESLRAMGLGRFEENYELTTALAYIAATGDSKTAKDVLKPLKGLRDGSLSKSRGGSTSTGGGGNDIAALVKLIFLTMVDDTNGAWSSATRGYPTLRNFTKPDRFDLAVRIRIETNPRADKILLRKSANGLTYILPEAPFLKPLPNAEFSLVIAQLISLIANESP